MDLSRGYAHSQVALPDSVRALVEKRDWAALDRAIAAETKPGGLIFDQLRPLAEFTEIEFILSIRCSDAHPDEDGIWHDDGSRVLAFSLSLSLRPELIEGGRLEIRKRFEENAAIERLPTPSFGTMIIFATGRQGFEHKINRVTRGERVIAAGWCS